MDVDQYLNLKQDYQEEQSKKKWINMQIYISNNLTLKRHSEIYTWGYIKISHANPSSMESYPFYQRFYCVSTNYIIYFLGVC